MTTSPDGTAPPDSTAPAAQAAQLRQAVAAAIGRFRRTAAGLSDQQAREPSALPGWSRGHVLAHLARNADSLRNLLIWARTGTETPQYRDAEERAEGIEIGAGRPAAELLTDLDASAAELDAETDRLPDDAWAVQVRGIRGNEHPAWYTLWRRLTELEFHHVDLAAGYGPADWPQDFAAIGLERVAADFAGPHCPAVELRASDVPVLVLIGPGGQADAAVTGPVRALLAWLTGRGDGAGLSAEPAGPLPVLPPW